MAMLRVSVPGDWLYEYDPTSIEAWQGPRFEQARNKPDRFWLCVEYAVRKGWPAARLVEAGEHYRVFEVASPTERRLVKFLSLLPAGCRYKIDRLGESFQNDGM